MKDKISSKFSENLDAVFFVEQEMIPEHGEDSYTCAYRPGSAMVAVCDGCGGLGSRTYASTNGRTEAYFASRMVSGAVYDWFDSNHNNVWRDGNLICESLSDWIRKTYAVGSSYIQRGSRIRGSMVRDFPTTLAMAMVQQVGKELFLHVIWAGDSRVYLFDADGLAQLTKDDVESDDAMSNLSDDGALTNVLSSDGKFDLHYKCLKIAGPCLIFAATDGCFGYTPTPMEFEHMVLRSIAGSRSPAEFEGMLKSAFSDVTGDDFSFGCMSFRYVNYENLVYAAQLRVRQLEAEYIGTLRSERSDCLMQQMWNRYRENYERFLGT